MVGKRNSKTDEEGEDFKLLKLNNKTLAKALSEVRIMCKQYIDERNILQKKLNNAMLLNVRYENLINQISSESKHILPVCEAMFSNITQMIKLCSDGKNLPKTLDWDPKDNIISPSENGSISPVGASNKTHAVKPMVGGHVIFRPTINLWRLSDTNLTEYTANLESQTVNLNVPNARPERITSNNNFNFTSNSERQPIEEFRTDIYDEDVSQTGVEHEFNSSEFEEEHQSSNENRISRRQDITLHPVIEELENSSIIDVEEVEEIVTTPVTFSQPRVLLETLPLTSLNKTSSQTKKKTSSVQEDPLEGPSNLLDNAGHLTPFSKQSQLPLSQDSEDRNPDLDDISNKLRFLNNLNLKRISKPRAANSLFSNSNQYSKYKNLYCFDSDSSSDDESLKEYLNKQAYSKRKASSPVENHSKLSNNSNSHLKNKKLKSTSFEDQNKKNSKFKNKKQKPNVLQTPPFVLLTRQNFDFLQNHESNNINNTTNNSVEESNRPRRNKVKGSFKEKSLRSKLRRD